MTPRTRPALSGLPDDDDQVPRLARFKADNPGAQFAWPGGMAQACLPHEGKEVTMTRHTLRALLDDLDVLLSPEAGE